jgi:NAD(P)H-nitrite reductase large subunit
VARRTAHGSTNATKPRSRQFRDRPNVALAEAAGLEVNNGICVNSSLQTNHPDIYAAGDIANF